jgi:hypothetical protein
MINSVCARSARLRVASLSYTLVLSGEAKEDEQTMVLKQCVAAINA